MDKETWEALAGAGLIVGLPIFATLLSFQFESFWPVIIASGLLTAAGAVGMIEYHRIEKEEKAAKEAAKKKK